MQTIKDILKKLEEGQVITINNTLEIFYISKNEVDDIIEEGFYINYKNKIEEWYQDKISNEKALQIISELLK